jgi:hypothetical protein
MNNYEIGVILLVHEQMSSIPINQTFSPFINSYAPAINTDFRSFPIPFALPSCKCGQSVSPSTSIQPFAYTSFDAAHNEFIEQYFAQQSMANMFVSEQNVTQLSPLQQSKISQLRSMGVPEEQVTSNI